MSIKKVIDIGPRVNISDTIFFKKIKIKTMGIKSRKYISNLLKNSKIGLVFYPVGQMTKSGIIAAYASHGVVIINFCAKEVAGTNEYISNVNYISKDSRKLNNLLQKISSESFKNYKKYALRKTASLIINYLQNK